MWFDNLWLGSCNIVQVRIVLIFLYWVLLLQYCNFVSHLFFQMKVIWSFMHEGLCFARVYNLLWDLYFKRIIFLKCGGHLSFTYVLHLQPRMFRCQFAKVASKHSSVQWFNILECPKVNYKLKPIITKWITLMGST
jgi:hypothetical protein